MPEIPLSKGKVAIVDECDVALVSKFKWAAQDNNGRWYARTSSGIYMHRLISGAKKGMQVDHANGNGLDNRRANVRECTRTQNHCNRRKITNKTGFKGVHQFFGNKWAAQIRIAGKRKTLGTFNSPREAANAYDAAARAAFGDFAATNAELVGG